MKKFGAGKGSVERAFTIRGGMRDAKVTLAEEVSAN
jgi:hypothetical protein